MRNYFATSAAFLSVVLARTRSRVAGIFKLEFDTDALYYCCTLRAGYTSHDTTHNKQATRPSHISHLQSGNRSVRITYVHLHRLTSARASKRRRGEQQKSTTRRARAPAAAAGRRNDISRSMTMLRRPVNRTRRRFHKIDSRAHTPPAITHARRARM